MEQNTTWSSKSKEKDKMPPGLARAMEMTKYYLVKQEQWTRQNTTWTSKSNGQDKMLPGLATAMERTNVYPGLARTIDRTKCYLV
jgi:hypothetical protein